VDGVDARPAALLYFAQYGVDVVHLVPEQIEQSHRAKPVRQFGRVMNPSALRTAYGFTMQPSLHLRVSSYLLPGCRGHVAVGGVESKFWCTTTARRCCSSASTSCGADTVWPISRRIAARKLCRNR